jgi:endoglucanase
MVEQGSRLIAKSLDDRIGCAIAIETLRRLKTSGTPHEVYFVFTVQEEVGVRGAQPAAFGLMPDLGIAVDVTSTGDTPKGAQMAVEMGQGVAIKMMDKGHIVPPAVRDAMIQTAKENNIPYQLEVLELGSTDARVIQIAQSGVPAGVVSIPARHLHTSSESVDMGDVQASIDLLSALLAKPLENIRPT